MGIGVSKQAAAGSSANHLNNHHHIKDSTSIHDVKPIISPATTRNSNASFISTGFSGGFDHHHVRQPSVRRQFQPMPDRQELDQRFAKVLVSNNYNNKWIVVGGMPYWEVVIIRLCVEDYK